MPHRPAFARLDALALIAVAGLGIAAAVPMVSHVRRGPTADQRNLAALVQAMSVYTGDHNVYSPAYVYGAAQTGLNWNIADQIVTNPSPASGYIHWSGMLEGGAYINAKASFESPLVPRGGAPAANPGRFARFWEAGQLNTLGSEPAPSVPDDRQAKRLAYIASRAILSRNRLTSVTPRHDRLVPAAEISSPARTILFTELHNLGGAQPWSIAQDPGTFVYKSHRPVNPFQGLSAGADVYNEPDSPTVTHFQYAPTSAILPPASLGPGMMLEEGSSSSLNGVARSGPDAAADFAMVDGSVIRATVQQSISQRLWGERFYSISGNNAIRP